MHFRHTDVEVAGYESGVAGLCPVSADDWPRWYLVDLQGRLRGVEFDHGHTFFDLELPLEFEKPGAATLCASADGRYVAVVPTRGLVGALVDTRQRTVTELRRGDYHANISGWAVAFVRHDERDVLIHATEWNRLEAHELPSFTRLAPEADETSLDYFWGSCAVSPSGGRVASFGWFWHPIGSVLTFEVAPWLTSRSAHPKVPFGLQTDWWDGALCWVSETHFATFGCRARPAEEPDEEDDAFMNAQDGVVLVEASTGRITQYFDQAVGSDLGCDGRRLYVMGGEASLVIDLETGSVRHEPGLALDAWHPGARAFLRLPTPEAPTFRLTRPGGTLQGPVDLGAPGQPQAPVTPEALLVLADQLDEHGGHAEAIAHCRQRGPHGDSCWVLEALSAGLEPAPRG